MDLPAAFRRDIAEAKAVTLWLLGQAMRKPPPEVIDGSVQRAHRWLAARAQAASVARSPRSSRNALTIALIELRKAARE